MPRGCTEQVIELIQLLGIRFKLNDQRYSGVKLNTKFVGELYAEQQQVADALLAHDTGVLSATTAFGKTVIGVYMIAKRRVNTLVLVHRQQLMEQWKTSLATFLDIDPNKIGQIGGGKYKPTQAIDVATIQSLNKRGQIDKIINSYGHVIVDECHHISARSFERVVREAKARYILGLSATVTRKDGHQPIIFMQCGPVRYKVDGRSQAAARPFDHQAIIRKTDFHLPQVLTVKDQLSINQVYSSLIYDESRNDLIFDDVLAALEQKRKPLVITERQEHLQLLADRLRKFAQNVIVLHGRLGKKQRREALERLHSISDNGEFVILATGRFLGEGFDEPRLDTLFLTMPISWKGTLAQYAGRLHRFHQGKSKIVIYDYADKRVPMLSRMLNKRIAGYKSMGYSIDQ